MHIGSEVHVAAMRFDIVGKLAQVIVQVRNRVVFDCFAARPLGFPIRRVARCGEPALVKAVIHNFVRDLQSGIFQRTTRSLTKLFRLDCHTQRDLWLDAACQDFGDVD